MLEPKRGRYRDFLAGRLGSTCTYLCMVFFICFKCRAALAVRIRLSLLLRPVPGPGDFLLEVVVLILLVLRAVLGIRRGRIFQKPGCGNLFWLFGGS